jgi:hydrogenase maturation protein HypF
MPIPILAARFHNSVVELSVALCQKVERDYGVRTVALSGGVWQNRYLLVHSLRRLQEAGFRVLWHHHVPANDGCIALGQALIAMHQD